MPSISTSSERGGSRSVSCAAGVALSRSLDGLCYGLIGVVLTLYLPWLSASTGALARHWQVLPAAWLVASAWLLSGLLCRRPGYASLCFRLRLSALCAFGFSPFVSWWLRCSDVLYLVLGSTVACLAGVWFLLEFSTLLIHGAVSAGGGWLAVDARLSRVLLLYLVLIPVLSLHASFVAALVLMRGTALADLQRFWFMVPLLFRYLTVIPLLNLARVAWRMSGPLSEWNAEETGGDTGTAGAEA